MVEKKAEKTTTKKVVKKTPAKRTTKKKSTVNAKKTIVKTIPVKVEKEQCVAQKKKNCSKCEKVFSIVVGILILINIVLAGLVLCEKLLYNEEKIIQVGGVKSYEIYNELYEIKQFNEFNIDKTAKLIEQLNNIKK